MSTGMRVPVCARDDLSMFVFFVTAASLSLPVRPNKMYQIRVWYVLSFARVDRVRSVHLARPDFPLFCSTLSPKSLLIDLM